MAIQNKKIQLTGTDYLEYKTIKNNSLFSQLISIIRFIFILVQNIYSVAGYLIITRIILLPVRWYNRDVYNKLENQQYNALLFVVVSAWSLSGGVRIVENGDDFKNLIDFDGALNSDNGPDIGKNPSHNHNEATLSNTDDPDCDDPPSCSGPNNTVNYNLTYKTDHNVNDEVPMNITGRGNCKDLKDEQINLYDNQEDRTILGEHECKTKQGFNDEQLKHGLDSCSGKMDMKKSRILLLCNHISTADVPLLMQAFSTTKNLSILWVLDNQFKITHFGLVCSCHGDFFIAKDSFTEGSLTNQALKYAERNVLALFPEGGFLRNTRDGSQRYAIKHGLPMTKYVSHPRLGAFKDLIDERVGITHIVDATLLYDDIEKPISILDIILGTRNEMVLLNLKVYARGEINLNEDWLTSIWLEKDRLLQDFYDNNRKQLHVQTLIWSTNMIIGLF